MFWSKGISSNPGSQVGQSTAARPTDAVPSVCLLSWTHSQHSYLADASGKARAGWGQEVRPHPPSPNPSPSALPHGTLPSPMQSSPARPFHTDAGFLCHVAAAHSKACRNQGHAELWAGWRSTDRGVILGCPSEPPPHCGPREAPLDNVFQVFSLKTKKFFCCLRMKSPH